MERKATVFPRTARLISPLAAASAGTVLGRAVPGVVDPTSKAAQSVRPSSPGRTSNVAVPAPVVAVAVAVYSSRAGCQVGASWTAPRSPNVDCTQATNA